MDLDTLARAVDARVHLSPADRAAARLYGVRLEGGGGSPVGTPEVVLDEIGEGDARELARWTRLPAGLAAVALATTAWAAPLDPGDRPGYASVRPSRHPERRRMHVTVLIGGAGEDVSVLREPGQEPVVVRDGIGVVHELLARCWSRRADAGGHRSPNRRSAPVAGAGGGPFGSGCSES